MPRFVKQNSNGPTPGAPHDDDAYERTLDRTLVREMLEDLAHTDKQRARRAGLQCDYTKAPWWMRS